MQDFYKILGVGKDADDETIAKAYKALAKRLHPDANAAADSQAGDGASAGEEKLRDVIEAYKALRKPAERAAYDEAWNNRRAELRRSILIIAVLAMAGSVTIASLSAAYLWRAELLTAREMVGRPIIVDAQNAGNQNADKSQAEAEVAPPPPRLAERAPAAVPLSEAPKSETLHLPAPAAANSPTAREITTVTGPVRVAHSVPALMAAKAGEVVKFADVAVSDVAARPDAEADAELESAAHPEPDPDIEPAQPLASEATVGPHRSLEPPVMAPPPVPQLRHPRHALSTASDADSDSMSLPLPDRPPSQADSAEQPVLTREEALAMIDGRYLTGSNRNRRTLFGLYCNKVDYWGEKATTRSSVVNQIADFVSRWPYRTYKLRPGSFEFASTGHPLKYKAEFTYEFTVASGYGYGGAAGVAIGQLIFERQNGRWRICSEEGRVLQRNSPYSEIGARKSSRFAGSPVTDTHRIVFGD